MAEHPGGMLHGPGAGKIACAGLQASYITGMAGIYSKPDTRGKLAILSEDSRYDLACSCGSSEDEHRRRSGDGRWIYPVTLQNGGRSALFKTLVSNVCVNDCKYSPLRSGPDTRRCTLEADELVKSFMGYLKAGRVFGIFLTSGVTGTPDATMDRLVRIARQLRTREQFRGYIHLKIIPGASDAAVEEAVSLASAVSLNIETAGESHFMKLSGKKDYMADIIRPIRLISRLTAPGMRHHRVRQSTQFVVGASDETDREIVHYSAGLYGKLGMDRIYFSAYQRGCGESDLPGEKSSGHRGDILTREHRLYQVDWLLRKYGFEGGEIPFDEKGNLLLSADPKEVWAARHPEAFPVNINTADRSVLLRVPGIGLRSAGLILNARKQKSRIRSLSEIGLSGRLAAKAKGYFKF